MIIFIPVLLVLNVCPVKMSAFCNEKKPTHRIYLPNDRNSSRDAESPTDLLYFPFKLISSGSYFKDFKTMTFRVFPQRNLTNQQRELDHMAVLPTLLPELQTATIDGVFLCSGFNCPGLPKAHAQGGLMPNTGKGEPSSLVGGALAWDPTCRIHGSLDRDSFEL